MIPAGLHGLQLLVYLVGAVVCATYAVLWLLVLLVLAVDVVRPKRRRGWRIG